MEFIGGTQVTNSTLAPYEQDNKIINQLFTGIPFMQSLSSSSSSSSLPSSPFFYQALNQIQELDIIHDHTLNMSPTPSSLLGSNIELGELDEGFLVYLNNQADDDQPPQNQNYSSIGVMGPTRNTVPFQPMLLQPSIKITNHKVKAPDETKKPRLFQSHTPTQPKPSNFVKQREANRKGPTSSSKPKGPKAPDSKAMRRLAQNREAARKSRLRKKAYVQQLEASRIRLAQLEHQLQIAIAHQGTVFGDQGVPSVVTNISSDAAVFDMEYKKWVEENHRMTTELKAAMQEELSEYELKMYVENCLAHYDIVRNLKSTMAKSDVFHVFSGEWKSPAERCFSWIGGFRPSHLIKIIMHQMEGLTEEQLIEICGMEEWAKEIEDKLTKALEHLHHSISDQIATGTLTWPLLPTMPHNYMHHMTLAINNISNLENFVTQAENLRQETLHRMHQILTTRQTALCFLAMAEYSTRVRSLSSLWLTRHHDLL